MIACHICGEKKGKNKFSDKLRDKRLGWCKECATMYEEMKSAKREAEWNAINQKSIDLLRLSKQGSFQVSFK